MIKKFFLKIMVLTIFCISIFIIKIDMPQKENLIGSWTGESQDIKYIYEFNEDKTCFLRVINKITKEVQLISGVYQINPNKSPMPLTIKKIPQLNHPLYSIVEFSNENSIAIANFSPRWKFRPISFKNDGHIIFSRFEKLINIKI